MTGNRRLSLVVLLVVVATVSGCASWHRSPLSPDRQVVETTNRLLRVHLKDGRSVEMESPRVVGDSLRGSVRPSRHPVGRRVRLAFSEPAAVAIADIQDVEVRKGDAWRTLLLSVLLLGLATLILIGASIEAVGLE